MNALVNKTNYIIDCETVHNRYGFNHIAKARLANGEIVKAKVHWINRTWEVHQYDTVKNRLANEIAKAVFGVKSDRSYYETKKWAIARDYAKSLKFSVL